MAKKAVKEEVVEAEFTEVEETVEPVVRTAVTITMTEEGNISFVVGGTDQSLVNMDALLKYAERHMDRVWAQRLAETSH